ncbi:MAG: phosphoribosylamine--glycine ligase [Bacteroidota bacterium]|nr:phosphoribosylamine--glycine ligase [Bacteroidota bacterium]
MKFIFNKKPIGMNILVLGGGGREHAICWAIAKDSNQNKIFIAPGNSGTASLGENVELNPEDFSAIEKFVLQSKIELVIVGPEAPIVKGIYDFFKANKKLKDVLILSPSKEGSLLEGSKEYAKKFMIKHNIPTAAYQSFTKKEYEKAKKYLERHKIPVVVKADGLAAGKGVTVAESKEQALKALEELFLDDRFGEAGEKVVIEEFLDGIEVSIFVLTDGNNYVILPEAKDYKRIGEGDTGPNTGGMGAISPVPFATEEFLTTVKTKIIEPTIAGLKKDKIDYKGFVYFGLMNVSGNPYVIEYNVRLGDPEAEVILPRIDENILPLLKDAAKGELKPKKIQFVEDYSATLMLVSGGYPGSYEKEKVITGFEKVKDSIVFHAGAKAEGDKILSSGGRVLGITSLAKTLSEAVQLSLKNAENISFEKKNYRRDIGKDLMKF